MGVGKVEHFLAAVAETKSFHPAAAPCDQRLHLLKSGVFLVTLQIGERDQAFHARVRRGHKNDAASDNGEQAK